MDVPSEVHDDNHIEEKESLWEVYLGVSGSSVVAFLYIAFAIICIFSFLRWG